MRLFVFVALFVLLATGTQAAYALPDSIYITIPPGGQRYITLQLPDDSGWAGRGGVEYTITMTPSSDRTWSDFSEQIVRTDENNTVQIPIYFKRSSNASCGENFRLTISAPSVGAGRVINGGACESSFAGASTAPAQYGQNTSSALNQNFGMFDIAFAEQSYFAGPNEIVNITVLAGSYQDNLALHAVLSAAGASVSPAAHDINFGAGGGNRRVQFSVLSPSSPGTYSIALAGSVPGCMAQACSITRYASLVVGGSQPQEGGFSMQLFPSSISTSQNKPATYMLTVHSSEVARRFNISMLKPYGISTDFREQEFMLAAGAEKIMEFNITPTGNLSSYEFVMYAKSGENTKTVSGYLNVDGMEAGAQRGLEAVQATGNQSAMQQANDAYSRWSSNPSVNGYGTLQDELSGLASQQPAAAPVQNASNITTPPVVPYQNYTPSNKQGSGLDIFGKDMWILIAIAAAGLVVFVFFSMRKKGSAKGGGLNEEFAYKDDKEEEF